MVKLILVLGDQLSVDVAALKAADLAQDVVVMAEVTTEAEYVGHHPKKIALIFAAMRKFAARLQAEGWRVAYTKLDDPDNAGSIPGELLRRAAEFQTTDVIATQPGEWRLIDALNDVPLTVTLLEDDRFIATHSEFQTWADGRKALRMEYFYRDMRRKTGLLMNDGDPEGGQWNFDHDNRKPAPDKVDYLGPMHFDPDDVVKEVLELVQDRFAGNFGDLHPFTLATDTDQAEAHLQHWLEGGAPLYGDFQDAMLRDHRFLYHAFVGAYINIGLLNPLEVCRAVEAAYRAGHVPLNAAEGFIRQIIGWREYVRGIYFLEGRDYTQRNILDHQRKLPDLFWGGKTWMNCMSHAVAQTKEDGYAHHIQRLMVTGNFALLAGIDPAEVHEWYLAVYIDAFEWVEAPNVIGMSQFADGGVIASKPYVSSGNYINKMSDYCAGCSYKVKDKTGPDACPFNLLYWDFLIRHRDRFSSNPRMGQMYRVWDKMAEDRQTTVLSDAKAFLEKLDAGTTV